jgi:hypothetical protein
MTKGVGVGSGVAVGVGSLGVAVGTGVGVEWIGVAVGFAVGGGVGLGVGVGVGVGGTKKVVFADAPLFGTGMPLVLSKSDAVGVLVVSGVASFGTLPVTLPEHVESAVADPIISGGDCQNNWIVRLSVATSQSVASQVYW